MAPFAVQGAGAGAGILSPSGSDGIVPVAFGVDDSSGVAGYADPEIDRMRVRAITLSAHKIGARLKGVKGCAVRIVGGLGEVCSGDGVTGLSACRLCERRIHIGLDFRLRKSGVVDSDIVKNAGKVSSFSGSRVSGTKKSGADY